MAGLVVYKGFELLQRKIGVERAQKLLQVHGIYLAVTIACVCVSVWARAPRVALVMTLAAA